MPDLKTAMRAADRPENKSNDMQDIFLNRLRSERALVTIHLLTGAKLTGKIRSFDKFSLVLESNHQEQLIFKHAVASIAPQARGGGSDPNGGLQAPGGAAAPNTHSEG